ncbi:MAG: hypothetical protein V4727_05980, partial [Verrucomicrobiota bacterium]
NPTGTTFQDTAIVSNTIYHYVISAINAAGESPNSNQATVNPFFNSWAGTYSLAGNNALPTANPDGDILNNLQEFAFGTNPNSNTLSNLNYTANGAVTTIGLPIIQDFDAGAATDFRAVFTRRKTYLTDGLIYTVQFSADLINWTNNIITPTILTGSGVSNPSGVEAVSVPFPAAVTSQNGSQAPRFFRVGTDVN